MLHIIDFEGHPRYGVVEYGVVTLSKEGIVETTTALCAPTGEIPPADTRIHGIDVAMAAGREPFTSLFDTFVEFRRSGLFVAHNACVEHRLIKSTWAYPSYVPDWSGDPHSDIADWGPWLDTLMLARERTAPAAACSLEALSYGGPLRREVDELAQRYCSTDRSRPHCALYDALATTAWLEATIGYKAAIDWFLSRHHQGQGELF